jgi:hypothetical protein
MVPCRTISVILIAISSIAFAASNNVIIGDSNFSMEIFYDSNSIRESVKMDSGQEITSTPWTFSINGQTVTPQNSSIKIIENGKDKLAFQGSNELFDWTLKYSIIVPSCITKTLTLKPKKQITLNSVSLWNAKSQTEPVIARTQLLDICAFYRGENSGLFVSLDFPYSKIKTADGIVRVTYPPNDQLNEDQEYICHSLTIGRTQLTKINRYGYDDGEVDAMDSYIQKRHKPRFNRPMTVTAGINNRYTQVADGEVFYTMKDNPTLSWNTDWLEDDIKLMAEVGIEYYQIWPGPFDATPNDPDPEYVKKVVKYANDMGVRVGDYSATEQLFCEHYNFNNNTHSQFDIAPADCHFGNKKFVDMYIARTTEYCKKYGFEEHCLDFLKMWKRAEGAADEEIIYAQVRGLTQVLEALNNVSDNMLTWTNSGVWVELLPKLAWYNDNMYLTDPFLDKPWPGLNQTRILDEVRRDQMVALHYLTFIPYRYFSNVQYFFCQNSITSDIDNYQYGALSTFAVVPNLGFGELRFWMESLPESKRKSVAAFYRKWLTLIKENYDLWTKTYSAGDKPGIGSLEIYGHVKDDHGYIFLVNSNYWDRNAVVPLNEQLGFKGNQLCEIKQIYPEEKLCLTNFGPLINLGKSLKLTVPPRAVIVLQVQPVDGKIGSPKVYGIPASVTKIENGYQLKISGPQGATQRFAVQFPADFNINDLNAVVRSDIPKQRPRSWKPTGLTIVAKGKNTILYEITFRDKFSQKLLSQWKISAGDLKTGTDASWQKDIPAGQNYNFPLFNESAGINYPIWQWDADKQGFGALANFCGGYIENAFSEDQETYIDIIRGGKNVSSPLPEINYDVNFATAQSLPNIAKDTAKSWWLQSEVQIPFMYGYGCEPQPSEHIYMVLPFINAAKVKTIKAWINGNPADVQEYKYPRNRSMSSYYIDLVGSAASHGNNKVVIYFSEEQQD